MSDLEITEKIVEILKDRYVCDRCLGRQFAQLLTGMSNEERGRILRYYLAMMIDSDKKINVNESNFFGIKFHRRKIKPKEPKKCSVCSDVFQELKKKVKLIERKMNKFEYRTLLVGSKLTLDLDRKEQELWDKIGIEWCESIKNEINREFGIELWKLTKKEMNRKTPDITILFDLNNDEVKLIIRSIYVFGRYQKLVRNIPQTKWKKKIFKTSVQEVIERPLLKQTKSKNSSFHGSGREDVNVRCLGWRPFVIELLNPEIRKFNLRLVGDIINKSKRVKVKNLKIVEKEVIKKLKFANYDKTYKVVVDFENPVVDLKRIKSLKDNLIIQKTPVRVLRRRSDLKRRRRVKQINYKILGKRKIEFKIRAESGLYIKELINGDEGRTEPSISGILNNKIKKIELDVIKIHENS